MGGECKIERYMPRQTLPDFFRELADALEHESGEGEFESVAGFSKLKLGVKDEFGQLSLKMKIKSPKACRAEAADVQADDKVEAGTILSGKPPYKKLKKRMKSSFKVILGMLRDGQTPPAEAVASFLADAELMTAYPDKGEEFYPDFSRVCQEFSDAYAAGDILRMGAMADELAHQKARCHAVYK